MYTDWGNLKVVSCVAWLERDGPGSSTVQQGMGALGASISRLTGPAMVGRGGGVAAGAQNGVQVSQLGDAGKFR